MPVTVLGAARQREQDKYSLALWQLLALERDWAGPWPGIQSVPWWRKRASWQKARRSGKVLWEKDGFMGKGWLPKMKSQAWIRIIWRSGGRGNRQKSILESGTPETLREHSRLQKCSLEWRKGWGTWKSSEEQGWKESHVYIRRTL